MALSFKQSLAYFWEQIGKQFVKNGIIDWAQNDETKSGYIKNRTHYIDFEETGESFGNVHSDGLFNIATDDSLSSENTVPPGYYAYMGYVDAPSKLFNESSNATGFKVTWDGKTYYSKILNNFETQEIAFGNYNMVIDMVEQMQGTTVPPEIKNELPELAIHNMPIFGILLYDPMDGVVIQLFTNKNFGDWVPIKVDILTGDGEIKKLDNIFLNDDVIVVEKAAPKTILNQIDIVYEENGTDSGYYYIADKELTFEANKKYDLILNGKTYSCYANKYNLYNSIPGCLFGNVADEFPEMISNPDANFVMFISSSFVSEGVPTTAIIFDPVDNSEYGASIKFSLVDPNTAPADAWVTKDAEGNIYWEEKTHGIIKNDKQDIVSVREYTLEELEGMLTTQWPQLQEGARYSITFGSSTWETVCTTLTEDGIQVYILGNIYEIMNGQDGIISNPPMVILQTPVAINGMYNIIEFDPDFNIGDIFSGETVRFGITKYDSIKKLDSKYIDWPDTIPVLSEKDGIVYKEIYNLEGTFDETFNVYSYPIEGLENFDWEEGCYYTVKTDNNTVLLQCVYYSGDMDSSSFWALADPLVGTIDGYVSPYHIVALGKSSLAIIYQYDTGTLISNSATTSLIIQDKQTYLNKINKYAIPGRLPLIPGSGEDSFQSNSYDSQANGVGSIALRRGSLASGGGSLAIGGSGGYQATEAAGYFSIAINSGKAYGDNSIACVGGETTTNARCALAYGEKVTAGSEYQIVLGKNNILDSNDTYGFIFGNGEITKPQNAFTINWNGKVWAKDLYMNGTNDSNASHVASETYVNNQVALCLTQSTADGRYQLKSERIFDTVSGQNNAMGPIGAYNTDYTLGYGSFTWGTGASAQAGYTFALGYNATVFSEANYSYALGQGATVYDGALNSYAIGYGATIAYDVDNAFAIGDHVNANVANQTVLGKYNKTNTSYLFVLGNGTSSARSNAFAVNSSGTGYFTGDLYVNGSGTTTAFTGAKKVATESYVDTKVAGLVDSAPGTLNTLNELAAALGDDPNFATTVATEIGKKADKTDLVALTEAEILEVCVIN